MHLLSNDIQQCFVTVLPQQVDLPLEESPSILESSILDFHLASKDSSRRVLLHARSSKRKKRSASIRRGGTNRCAAKSYRCSSTFPGRMPALRSVATRTRRARSRKKRLRVTSSKKQAAGSQQNGRCSVAGVYEKKERTKWSRVGHCI